MQLVDLLEVPQLVDACARNGFHDESLELANFVNGLERRHLLAAEVRPINGKNRMGSDVIQSIVDDVHSTLVGLRQQLLMLLSQQSSLPKELQILATLRKLDVLLIDRQLALERHENVTLAQMTDKQRDQLRLHFLQCSETRLQMEFLEARTVWLGRLQEKVHQGLPLASGADAPDKGAEGEGSAEEPVGSSSSGASKAVGKQLPTRGASGNVLGPYGKAIEMLEANRTSWFAVVTQFNALFEDSISETSKEMPHPASAILNAWITRHSQQLLVDLEKLVAGIDEGAAVRSVLEQALFFAARMGQVGCDFSTSIIPIFRKIVVSRVTADWKVASANFRSMLATERFVVEFDDVAKEQVVPLFLSQEQAATGGDDKSSSPAVTKRASDDVPAPTAIMTYPPIAYLMNALLCGLNFLRECPIVSAKEEIFSELRTILIGFIEYFASLAREIRSKGSKYLSSSAAGKVSDEDSLDKQYARALLRDFLPHVLSCFDHIYSPSTSTGGTGDGAVASRAAGKRGKAVALRIDSLVDATDHLSVDSMEVLEMCWKCAGEAKLAEA